MGALDQGAVVAMAVTVLEEYGVDAVSLAAVAKRLGVTQPALYRHVGSHEGLLRQLAAVGRQGLVDALRDAAIGRSGADAVRAVARAWRENALAHPQLFLVMDRVPLAGDVENERLATDIAQTLTRAIGSYGLDPSDAEQAAWALRSALHGFTDLEVRGGNPVGLDADATFDWLVELVVAGLADWGGSR